jgi:hypothetical protein
VISFAIIDDHVYDAKERRKVLENLRGKAKRIFGDKGYDSKAYTTHLVKIQ